MSEFHVSFPGLGIDSLTVDRIAFSINFGGREIDIYWYGIIIAVAFLIGIILATKQAPQFGIKSDDVIDTLLWIIVAAFIGARLYYVIFSWDQFSDDILKIFHMRDGGLAFYGGLIGGIIAVVISSKIKKINVIHLIDFLVVYVPLGQAIGRWGNFINQEAFGRNTDLPWGMFSEQTYKYLSQFGNEYAPLSPVHPTFLYESIANLIIFAILYKVRAKSKKTGKTLAWYLILYGIVRFIVEGLRTDSLYIANTSIRASQALSFVFVIIGVIILILAKKKTFNSKIEEKADKNDFVALMDLDENN